MLTVFVCVCQMLYRFGRATNTDEESTEHRPCYPTRCPPILRHPAGRLRIAWYISSVASLPSSKVGNSGSKVSMVDRQVLPVWPSLPTDEPRKSRWSGCRGACLERAIQRLTTRHATTLMSGRPNRIGQARREATTRKVFRRTMSIR
jgi:hypothetical protein